MFMASERIYDVTVDGFSPEDSTRPFFMTRAWMMPGGDLLHPVGDQ
jgi:hypothetical protein